MNKKNEAAPVLVDRDEAQALCGVGPQQFDRLVRAGRLENCAVVGSRELYRSAQCRAITEKPTRQRGAA
jgi:hypothetical protein